MATRQVKFKSSSETIKEFQFYYNSGNYERDLFFSRNNPESQRTHEFLNRIKKVMHSPRFHPLQSTEEKGWILRQIQSMIQHYGLPSWWVTLAPNYKTNSILVQLHDSFETSCNNSKDSTVQIKIFENFPGLVALVYESILKNFFSALIKLSCNDQTRKSCDIQQKGVLGTSRAYFGITEMQGSGCLHLHTLIWAGLSPIDLMQCNTPDVLESLVAYIQKTVTTNIDSNIYNDSETTSFSELINSKVLCEKSTINDINNYGNLIASKTNCHSHSPSCRKGKVGKWKCRYAFPQPMSKTIRPVLLSTDKSGQLVMLPISKKKDIVKNLPIVFLMKRPTERDKMVVSYNPTITAALKCNTCIVPLLSDCQVENTIFYLAKYMAKSDLKIITTLSLLHEANSRAKKYGSKNLATTTSENFLTKV